MIDSSNRYAGYLSKLLNTARNISGALDFVVGRHGRMVSIAAPCCQALLTADSSADNSAMLEPPPPRNAHIGARLKKRAEHKRVSVETIAKECGVTDKAVYGWFKTGRIAKRHLPILANLLSWTVEDIISDDAERTRQSAEEGRKDWSHEAQQLATLFDLLEPAKRRAAWPFLVRMIAQTQGMLDVFLTFPARDAAPKRSKAK